MEAKYTPGPWFVRFCDDSHSMNMTTVGSKKYSEHSHYYEEEDTVCIVFHQLEPRVSYEIEDLGDANARLIAAAPALLEALQDILKYHSDKPTGLVEGHELGGTPSFLNARSVIGRILNPE